MESKSYTDFEAFAASVGDVDADLKFQNPGTRIWSMQHVDLPHIHVQLGQLGSGNIIEGQSFPNGYVLYLPLTDACKYLANGTVVEHGSILIMEPGCEFCIATKSEHDWCSIFVPSDKVLGGGDEERSSRKMTCRVSPKNLRATGRFRNLVDQIIATAAKYPQFESSTAAAGVQEELLKVSRELLGEHVGQHRKGRPKIPRQEVIHCCQAYLEAHEGDHVKVNEMMLTAGVSRSTLDRIFNQYYRICPIKYLQLRELHQVNRALKSAEYGETMVSNILFDNGVYELGRFAARYRRLFGELPSESLRK